MRAFALWAMRSVSNRATKLYGEFARSDAPYVYVCEYPKAGGTWLSRMIADCLLLPFPQLPLFPLGFPCVVHNHWRPSPRLHRPVYLYRDGRDVMVSFYFHRMRGLRQLRYHGIERDRRRYERLFGKGYDPNDSVRHLPRFIEQEFRRPRGSRINWRDHVSRWALPERREGAAYVSYEELLHDTPGALARVLGEVRDEPVEAWRVEMAVEKFSIERQTGRKAGQEDRQSFIRKGVAGDWRNHFSREAAEVFDRLAGEALVGLGYEPDRAWAQRVPASGSAPEKTTTSSSNTESAAQMADGLRSSSSGG